jgi:hypothetical protein
MSLVQQHVRDGDNFLVEGVHALSRAFPISSRREAVMQRETEAETHHAMPPMREAIDAASDDRLAADPASEDGKLDIALDESFPGSDAPSNTRPGTGEPAASSGYDERAERRFATQEQWRAWGRRLQLPLFFGWAAVAVAGTAVAVLRRSSSDTA